MDRVIIRTPRAAIRVSADVTPKYNKIPPMVIENAKIEYDLVCTSHNLMIIWNKIGRNREILSQIGTVTTKIANNTRVCKYIGIIQMNLLL